jgi:hypothetical protein
VHPRSCTLLLWAECCAHGAAARRPPPPTRRFAAPSSSIPHGRRTGAHTFIRLHEHPRRLLPCESPTTHPGTSPPTLSTPGAPRWVRCPTPPPPRRSLQNNVSCRTPQCSLCVRRVCCAPQEIEMQQARAEEAAQLQRAAVTELASSKAVLERRLRREEAALASSR